MITLRPSAERGHFRSDWLDSFHTFSFDTYQDPRHMGFRSLRVINEDRVAPGQGFPLHRHENMEVITIIADGQLKHEDSLGHGSVIGPGEVQRFSAGTGIRHSEFNPSAEKEVHLLQIWIIPEKKGLPPSYEQKRFDPADSQGSLRLIASRDGRDGSITLHQDAALFRGDLMTGQTLEYSLAWNRHAWLQMIEGDLFVNGTRMKAGDGAAISDEPQLRLRAGENASFLLFDLA
jgi:quercetin 2,3-dioxygenase